MATNDLVDLPIKESIKVAWEKTYGFKGTLLLGLLIFFLFTLVCILIQTVAAYYSPTTFHEDSIAQSILGIIFEILSYLFQMGLLYLGLLRAANLPVTYSQVFYPFKAGVAFRLIGVYILEAIIFMLCIMIMIIPPALRQGGVNIPLLVVIACVTIGVVAFIYFLVRMMFAMAFVLERNSGPFSAIKNSIVITRGNFWNLVGIIILEILIIAVSIIPLGIGLFWSIPFAYVLYGEVYKRLLPNLFVR